MSVPGRTFSLLNEMKKQNFLLSALYSNLLERSAFDDFHMRRQIKSTKIALMPLPCVPRPGDIERDMFSKTN